MVPTIKGRDEVGLLDGPVLVEVDDVDAPVVVVVCLYVSECVREG